MGGEVFDSVAGEGPDVVLLHGLFGMGNNLGALSRSLQDHYRVHSLDLPNHGRSAWTDNMELGELAAAVARWMDHRQLQGAHFVGHSLGGKVAMQLALDEPYRVDALVVADIAPVAYAPHHDQVFAALAAVDRSACESRNQAAAIMSEYLREDSVIQFLLLSLSRGEDGVFRWRFNYPVLRDCYDQVRAAVPAQMPFTGRTLFIRGGASDFVLPEHEPAIRERFPQAEIRELSNCGHWLHVEQPGPFNALVREFLDG